MSIDKKHVKGRGTTEQIPNRFLQRSYAVVHPEGVDMVEEAESDRTTRFIATHPRTIINKVDSADLPFSWSMNPYQGCEHGCSYCYARPTHEYWGYSAGLDFERIILVKRNAPELFQARIRDGRWSGEPVNISGVTDPYQPRERVERLTRRILEIALDHGQPIQLITKNALILRDLDILGMMAEQRLVHVAISLTTLNEDLRRVLEPRTSAGQKRLQAIGELSSAGIPVMAMLAPVIPALNQPEIPVLLKSAAEAGAMGASYTVLRTNGAVKPVFEEWLQRNFPDRAAKVMAQTAELHGGATHDTRVGRRMRGEGNHAATLARLFKVLHARYFQGRSMPALDRSRFHVPLRGQLDLFS